MLTLTIPSAPTLIIIILCYAITYLLLIQKTNLKDYIMIIPSHLLFYLSGSAVIWFSVFNKLTLNRTFPAYAVLWALLFYSSTKTNQRNALQYFLAITIIPICALIFSL